VPLSFSFIQTLHMSPEMCTELVLGKQKHYSIGFQMEKLAHSFYKSARRGASKTSTASQRQRHHHHQHERHHTYFEGVGMHEHAEMNEEEEEEEEEPWYKGGLCKPVELNTSKVRKATWTELFYDLVYVTVVARLGETLRGEHGPPLPLQDYALYIITLWVFWKTTNEYATLFMNDDLYHKLLFAVYMLALVTVGMHIEGGPESHNGAAMAISFLALRLTMLFAYGLVVVTYLPKRAAWPSTFRMAVHVCFFLCLDAGIYLFAYYDAGNRRRCFWVVAIYNHLVSVRGLELIFAIGSSESFFGTYASDRSVDGNGACSSVDAGFAQAILQLRYDQWRWNSLIWYIQIAVMAFSGIFIFCLGYFVSPLRLSSSSLLLVLVLLMVGVIILNLADEVVDNIYSARVRVACEGFQHKSGNAANKDFLYLKHSPGTVRGNLKALRALQDAVNRRVTRWESFYGDTKNL